MYITFVIHDDIFICLFVCLFFGLDICITGESCPDCLHVSLPASVNIINADAPGQ